LTQGTSLDEANVILLSKVWCSLCAITVAVGSMQRNSNMVLAGCSWVGTRRRSICWFTICKTTKRPTSTACTTATQATPTRTAAARTSIYPCSSCTCNSIQHALKMGTAPLGGVSDTPPMHLRNSFETLRLQIGFDSSQRIPAAQLSWKSIGPTASHGVTARVDLCCSHRRVPPQGTRHITSTTAHDTRS